MIYLDYGATSMIKPPQVYESVQTAMRKAASAGRGGYGAAMQADQILYDCRERAAGLFSCRPEQVAFTMNATHALNIAIRTLVRPGATVAVTGFEHNAVMRPLYALGAKLRIAGRMLFDREDTLNAFRQALSGADAAVFTQASNVFGYILPVEQMAKLCRERGIPFIIDASQAAGVLPVSMALGADFIAMPGHKGLLGPQGTGILLCGRIPEPLIYGGTGAASLERGMPQDGPERIEAGTQNIAGIAGLAKGIQYLQSVGTDAVYRRERQLLEQTVHGLRLLGIKTFHGENQMGTVSILPQGDVQQAADELQALGIAVRAGLHCAPLAHESAGTLQTGTVRISFGWASAESDVSALLRALTKRGG